MPVEVEITSSPGLIDPDTGQPTADQPYEDALSDFLSSTGVANTDVEVAIQEALQGTDEGLGWWSAIRGFLCSGDTEGPSGRRKPGRTRWLLVDAAGCARVPR